MGDDGQWGRLPQRQTQRTAGSEDIATSAQTLQPLAEREGLAYEPQLALEERSWGGVIFVFSWGTINWIKPHSA